MEILSADRSVDVTPEAAAKQGDASQGLESVFSASVLPIDFFRDLVKGHSAKGMFLGQIADLSIVCYFVF